MTKKRITFILLLLTLSTLSTMVIFSSCSDNTAGKTPFSPEMGMYTLYFDEGWTKNESGNPYQLVLSDTELESMLTIECYIKDNLSEQGIDNLDSYIEAYKEGEMTREIYEKNTVDAIESFKEKQMLNGKRQKIHISPREEEAEEGYTITYIDSTTEFIYFETADYYFTLSYNNAKDKFEDSQKKINDALKTLKIN